MILYESEMILIKQVKKTMVNELKQKRGKYSRLNPMLNTDTGIWEVGHRLGKHNPMFILILLQI